MLVQDYGWLHRGFGLVGNFAFVVGSILFLPTFAAWQTVGVWLFIGGSALMFCGAAGEFAVKLYETRSAGRNDEARG